MKTDDLIAALAADTRPETGVTSKIWRGFPLALALSAAAIVTLWHVRPDLGAALGSAALIKTLAPAVLGVAAALVVPLLTRPEQRPGARGWLAMGLVALWVLALLAGLARDGVSGMVAALSTPNTITCLVSVPILSALPLAALLWAMKSGAPRDPKLAGAGAGLMAAGSATAIYSLHCPVDDMLFFLPAYGAAIGSVVILGAVIGAKILRW